MKKDALQGPRITSTEVDSVGGREKMATTTAAFDKQAADARLTAKVASMSKEERLARAEQLAGTTLTPETSLEFAKLIFGPDASIAG